LVLKSISITDRIKMLHHVSRSHRHGNPEFLLRTLIRGMVHIVIGNGREGDLDRLPETLRAEADQIRQIRKDLRAIAYKMTMCARIRREAAARRLVISPEQWSLTAVKLDTVSSPPSPSPSILAQDIAACILTPGAPRALSASDSEFGCGSEVLQQHAFLSFDIDAALRAEGAHSVNTSYLAPALEDQLKVVFAAYLSAATTSDMAIGPSNSNGGIDAEPLSLEYEHVVALDLTSVLSRLSKLVVWQRDVWGKEYLSKGILFGV
jgi:hypothetical protein